MRAMALSGTIWETSKITRTEYKSLSNSVTLKLNNLWDDLLKNHDHDLIQQGCHMQHAIVKIDEKYKKRCSRLNSVIAQKDSELNSLKDENAELWSIVKATVTVTQNTFQRLTSEMSVKETELKKAELEIDSVLENNTLIIERDNLPSILLTQSQSEEGNEQNLESKIKINSIVKNYLKEVRENCDKIMKVACKLKVAKNAVEDEFNKLKVEYDSYKINHETCVLSSNLENFIKRSYANIHTTENTEINNLKKQVKDLERQIHLLQVKSEGPSKPSILSKEIKELQENNVALNNLVDELKRIGSEKESVIDNLSIKHKNAENKLTKLNQIHIEYKKKKNMNERTTLNTLNSIQEQNNKLTSKFKRTNAKLKTKSDEIKVANQIVESLMEQLTEMDEKTILYESSSLKQNESLKSLQGKHVDNIIEINRLKKIIKHLQLECQILKESEARLKRENEKMLKSEKANQSLFLKVKDSAEQHWDLLLGNDKLKHGETINIENILLLCKTRLSKIKELENQCCVYQKQIDALKQESLNNESQIKELMNKELLKIETEYSDYRQKSENNIKEAKETVNELKKTIEQLKKNISNQSSDGRQNIDNEFLQYIKEQNANLDNANAEIKSLSDALKVSKEKYVEEKVMHSNDIQTIIKLKEQLFSTVSNMKNEYNLREKKLLNNCEEVQSQLLELKKQNSILYEQLQMDDESKRFLNIIKMLEKEKESLDAKYNIILIENNKYKLELDIMKKKINDSKMLAKREATFASRDALPNLELFTGIEKYSSMTDSNILLRQKNENLTNQVTELTESCKEFDKELKRKSVALLKMEVLQTENNKLMAENCRWRARLEKANNYNPKCKTLLDENEALSKELITKNDDLKKLNIDLAKAIVEKETFQNELNNIIFKMDSLTELFNKQTEETNTLKETSSKMSIDLIKTNETNFKLTDSLEASTLEIANLRKSETNIKQIALKYKTEYQDLFNEIAAKRSDNPNQDLLSDSGKLLKDLIDVYREKTENLEKQIEILCENQDNIDDVQKEVDGLNETNTKLTAELAEVKNSVLKIKEEMNCNILALQSQHEKQIANMKRKKMQVEKSKTRVIAKFNKQLKVLQQQIRHNKMINPSINSEDQQDRIKLPKSQNVIDFLASSSMKMQQSCDEEVPETMDNQAATSSSNINAQPKTKRACKRAYHSKERYQNFGNKMLKQQIEDSCSE